MKLSKNNQKKFKVLREFKLPIGQYAITGSGPLGIRNLKEIGDIDIIVTDSLWNLLLEKFELIRENGIEKIIFTDSLIEAFKEGSFPKIELCIDQKAPTIAHRIATAEIIDALPFDTLETILFFKKLQQRPKDLEDIQLIETLLGK